MIKTLPVEYQPREKALKEGIESLSDFELLALILRTGNKDESVLDLSKRLINEIGGFHQLLHVNYATLSSLKGIKKAKAIEILSIVEISRRLKQSSHHDIVFNDLISIYNYLKDEMMFLKQEHFLILCLDHKHHLIKKKTIFVGSLNMSIVTPREVFKEAIGVSSAKIVLVHNHPSGDALPSQEDNYLTSQFIELGDMLGIEVIDHMIVGWNQFYSIRLQKCFRNK